MKTYRKKIAVTQVEAGDVIEGFFGGQLYTITKVEIDKTYGLIDLYYEDGGNLRYSLEAHVWAHCPLPTFEQAKAKAEMMFFNDASLYSIQINTDEGISHFHASDKN